MFSWPDGDSWTSEKTVDEYKNGNSRHQSCESSHLWESTHFETHNKLYLAQRTDRTLLLSLYEQGHQIAQVNVATFGTLPAPQPGVVAKGHPTLEKAMNFMKPLAVAYATGEITDRAELKNAKAEKLKEWQQ